MILRRFIFSLLLSFAFNSSAFSSTGELYGYGSRASALGNTMIAGSTDAFATFYNPAALSLHDGFQFSFAVNYYKPTFTEIKGVVTSNSVFSDSGDRVGDVITDNYESHFGQMIAASYTFGQSVKKLSLGITGFLPIERLAFVDSGDPTLPEYFSYRSRTQRPQVYTGVGISLFPRLQLGVGLSFASTLSATTTVFATGSTNPQKVSTQRFSSTIKPAVAPYFSLYTNPGPVEFGVTVRLKNRYKVEIETTANANFLGSLGSIPLRLGSSSTIYYDPFEVDASFAFHWPESITTTFELNYLEYAVFETPILAIKDMGSVSSVQPTIDMTPPMRNIWVPKFGLQKDFEKISLRGGYLFRPSPIESNSGRGNLVDPAKHVFTAGIGFDLKKYNLTKNDLFLDLHAQYHRLVSDRVTKSSLNEVGQSGNKIGAPGYDIGGHIIGGGFSLTMLF